MNAPISDTSHKKITLARLACLCFLLGYRFKCDLCDAGYVGYTRRHLHQRVDEHKNASSSIGKHFRVKHFYVPRDLTKNFTTLKKCRNKFDCLIYEMFFY